jgi:hypothetical protein
MRDISPVQHFPHEIEDLRPILLFMERAQAVHDMTHWQLRYIVLLWLSLICRIPFDLALFDEDGDSSRVSALLIATGKQWLDRSGLERYAAAQLLSRLYMRYATSHERAGNNQFISNRTDMKEQWSTFLNEAQYTLAVDTDRPMVYFDVTMTGWDKTNRKDRYWGLCKCYVRWRSHRRWLRLNVTSAR